MPTTELDEVDRGILHALQGDARHRTTQEMGERVGVSASTVRNRIARLEEEGVIKGFSPSIDYGQAGFPLHFWFSSRVPVDVRSEMASEALATDGVVAVRELLTGAENLHIEAVANDVDDVDRITDELTDLSIEITQSQVIKTEHTQEFDHFGTDAVEEEPE